MTLVSLFPTPVPPAANVAVPADALARAVGHRREVDQAAVAEMVAVLDFAEEHRVEDGDYLAWGAIDPQLKGRLGIGSLRRVAPHGTEAELRLAGQGTFMVTEFAVCELAAALSMSENSARRYLGELIELRDRLPRLYGRVTAGVLPVWKARTVAHDTIALNAQAADYVDRHLAPVAHKLTLWRLEKAVQAAMLRHDPVLATERARKARDKRGVWVDATLEGVSTIQATVDTPDAAAFDRAVTEVATTLGELGDPDDLDVRRAKAVGVLADPQHALDLASTADAAAAGAEAPRRPNRRQVSHTSRTTVGGGPVLHVHLHTAATDGFTHRAGVEPVARVDGYGPRTLETVQGWIEGLAPGTQVTVTPVVDLNDYHQVDAYEAPPRIRDQIHQRDLRCVFPWCGRAGIFDLDHTLEYLPPDEGGPPGQTNTLNLAKMCRFHHRVKTYTKWDYQRLPDNAVAWVSPKGYRYRVDGTGTTHLT